MIDVVICDDHAVLRRGIRDTLSEATDIKVRAEAAGYTELREVLRATPCHVLLLDINMPGRNGLEVLVSVRESYPEIKVLMVSMYPEDQYALRCLKAGAHGYANKAGDPLQLVEAVRVVSMGRKFLTPEVAQMLADSFSQPAPEVPHESLSEREMQTLQNCHRQAPDGHCRGADAQPQNRQRLPRRVLEKLQLGNNAELTVYAIRNNLV